MPTLRSAKAGRNVTNLRDLAVKMARAAKTRSTTAGVPFSITADDITVPQLCPVLGIPLHVGQAQASDNSPSLDRVLPLLGYVPGNVLVISNRANRIKNNATIHELRLVADFFERHIKTLWMKGKSNG
jgi:hypothetical protein